MPALRWISEHLPILNNIFRIISKTWSFYELFGGKQSRNISALDAVGKNVNHGFSRATTDLSNFFCQIISISDIV